MDGGEREKEGEREEGPPDEEEAALEAGFARCCESRAGKATEVVSGSATMLNVGAEDEDGAERPKADWKRR